MYGYLLSFIKKYLGAYKMKELLRVLRSIVGWLDRIVEKLLIFLIFSMFITVLVQIFYRYIFSRFLNISLPYTEELARYITIWIVYLGIAIGLEEGLHVSLDLIYDKLSFNNKRLLYIVQRIMMIFFILTVLIFGWELLGRITTNKSASMRIPMTWAYSAPWIGAWLTILRLLVQLFDTLFTFDEEQTNFKDHRSKKP